MKVLILIGLYKKIYTYISIFSLLLLLFIYYLYFFSFLLFYYWSTGFGYLTHSPPGLLTPHPAMTHNCRGSISFSGRHIALTFLVMVNGLPNWSKTTSFANSNWEYFACGCVMIRLTCPIWVVELSTLLKKLVLPAYKIQSVGIGVWESEIQEWLAMTHMGVRSVAVHWRLCFLL